jgi:hypothetical protein
MSVAAPSIDLDEYLHNCGGSETIRFDFVEGGVGAQADAAREYAQKLRKILGNKASIVAEGIRVIISSKEL